MKTPRRLRCEQILGEQASVQLWKVGILPQGLDFRQIQSSEIEVLGVGGKETLARPRPLAGQNRLEA